MLRAMRAILLVMALGSTASAELYEEKPAKEKPKDLRCPTAAPCVVEYDFTYMVLANGWSKFYIADYGTPEAPLRKGTKTSAEVDARAAQAITEILTKQKAKTAKIECAVAAAVPELLGLGETIDVPVPKSTAKPIAKFAVKDVNALWVTAHKKLNDSRGPRNVFGADELAKMTATTFAKPTFMRMGQWVSSKTCQGDKCSEEITKEATLYVVYSPESADAYVVDASLEAPEKAFDKKSKQAHAGALAAISATLSSLGHKTVALKTSTMCGIPLVPGKGWFDWKAK